MRPMTPYMRNAVSSLAVVVLAGVAVIGFVVTTLATGFLETRDQLVRTRSLVASTVAPNATGAAAGPVANAAAAPDAIRVFRGTDPADVQSQFQTAVKSTASRVGFTIESLQVLKTDRAGGLTKISLRLDGSLPETNFGTFLVDLALGTPVIGVQGFELRPQAFQANRLPGAATAVKMITVRIDLAAFSAPPGKPGLQRPSP
jgi:Type II secretion system (T2SS), protein M subtype b